MTWSHDFKHFGTDGIRGIVGADFNAEYVFKIANSVAVACCPRKVIIGCDTRKSCDFIADIFSGVFAGYGADVVKVGIVPTAALSFLTHELKADFGVMISASHNDYRYNGVKFFAASGEKFGEAKLAEIDSLIDGDTKLSAVNAVDVGSVIQNEKALKRWQDFLTDKSKGGKRRRVAVDCAFGSGAECAETVLKALGFDAVLFNTEYDGININRDCGATEPAYLQGIMRQAEAEVKFDVGFAFDGDADRCVVLDHNGDIIHGDVLICCLAKYMGAKKVASTILFNLGAEVYLQKNGIKVLRTPVGDRFVALALKEHSLALGGETSGHVVFSDIWHSGDGLLTALMVLEMIDKSGKSLKELCDGIEIYPQAIKNIPVTNEQKKRIKSHTKMDSGYRTIVRPSGTENLVRIVVEGKDPTECENIGEQVKFELFT